MNINYNSSLVYTEPCDFSYSYRDTNNNPFPSHILQVFQDVAGDQCAKLGIGYKELIAQDLIWVLVKVRFKIIKNIPYEKTTAVTWPQKKRVLEFNREFLICDANKDVCVEATSRWCLVNVKTRKLAINKIDYQSDDYERQKIFEDTFDLVPPFDTSSLVPSLVHQVVFTDLDHNKHMNNTHYASLVIDSLPNMEDYKVDEMQIHFQKECSLGEKIKVYSKKLDDVTYQTLGLKEDSTISFDAKTILKHI
jgi:medium-chain acyl-[acyl-carrier-protein] hydrolase